MCVLTLYLDNASEMALISFRESNNVRRVIDAPRIFNYGDEYVCSVDRNQVNPNVFLLHFDTFFIRPRKVVQSYAPFHTLMPERKPSYTASMIFRGCAQSPTS